MHHFVTTKNKRKQKALSGREVAANTRVSVLFCETLFIVAVCAALVSCSRTVMFVTTILN